MKRFASKSALPLVLVLGLGCTVAGVTIAQAQDSRDPPSGRNLNDPASGRNLNDPASGRNLNDPAGARNLNADQQDPNLSRDADKKPNDRKGQ